MTGFACCLLAVVTFMVGTHAAVAQTDFRATLRAEAYAFDGDPLSPEQDQSPSRVALDLDVTFDLSDAISFTYDGTVGRADFGYSRINRLGFDVQVGASLFSLGYDTVLWSKSEFALLSNVINPRDFRFDPTGETTLGQPMLRWELPLPSGVLTSLVIPKPLPSKFPGTAARLRTRLPLSAEAQFERDQNTPAFALRYELSTGVADLGFYGYVGPSREAAILPLGEVAAPFYAWVDQLGVDAQFTFGATVAKFELRHTQNQLDRTGSQGDGFAASIGGEYTFYGVFGTPGDIALAAEYAWDERGTASWQNNQNDLFLGLRWSLQNTADTRFEIGLQQDLDFDTEALRFGFEHRILDGLVVKSELVTWLDSDPRDLAFGFSQDSYLRVSIEKSF
ncbi:MAG: hypothetical protein AAF999_08655 [Pseudomonadota bacterium]